MQNLYTKTIEENWSTIIMYMDDDIREQVHRELYLYTDREFYNRYCELDPYFDDFAQHI